MIIDLAKPDLRKVPIGTEVKTTKGFFWMLTERTPNNLESWLDESTGITWSDTNAEGINHYQAVERFGDKLPTKEEFETAEQHGIREVMDLSGRWFWASTVYPYCADYAYIFHGNDGDIIYDYRNDGIANSAALCVGR